MSDRPKPRIDSRGHEIKIDNRAILLQRIEELEEDLFDQKVRYDKAREKAQKARAEETTAQNRFYSAQVDLDAYRGRLRDLIPEVVERPKEVPV